MQSPDKIQCRACLNSPSPCGNMTSFQDHQASLLVGVIRVSQGHEWCRALCLTLSAQVNCTCCQQSVWLGLTSAILQFLSSLLIYFKWYLPHAVDSKVRKSTRNYRARQCRAGALFGSWIFLPTKTSGCSQQTNYCRG